MINKQRFFLLTGLILLAVASRFLPHPPNFAPIAAIALFGGAYFSSKKLAFIIPAVIMLASDLILGLHGTMLYVYLGFAGIVGLGFMLRNKISLLRIGGAALGGSTIFFIVSNFGVWLSSGFYAPTLTGLLECYTMAIPFFHYTLAGTVVYSSILFGVMEYVKVKHPELISASA